VRFLGELGRGRLAGANRPDRLVGDDEVLVTREHLDLPPQHLLGLISLALLLELADAGDHAQTGLERMPGTHCHRLVGLAEVLPPLRVADDRPLDAQLEEDLRRDLAGEGALVGPVHILSVDRVAALHCGAERSEGRAKHCLDGARRCEGRAELPRLSRALVHLPVAGDQHRPILWASVKSGGIALIPGRSLPSRSSSAAPPPVDAHETRSVRPSSFNARIESAPPTTENASAPATASATAFVPAANRGHSKTPIGPFQKIVLDSESSLPKRSRVSGPMSSPSQPPGRSSNAQTVDSAWASNDAAATTSTGNTTSKSSGFCSRSSSAILPPIKTVSAVPPSSRKTPSLSSTFAPPDTSTKGRSTSPSSPPSCSNSRSSNSPAYAGSSFATPTVDACAR